MGTLKTLVSTEWVAANLREPSVCVVDGSWYLPTIERDAAKEFEAAHIPGAVHFPIDEIADLSTGLPHMLAAPDVFANAVGGMGISERDTIVIYDGAGLFSAPRVWWNFKVMGAQNVFILEGGLPKWIDEDRPVEAGIKPHEPRLFSAILKPNAVATAHDVLGVSKMGGAQIVDLRPAPRFAGDAPEPRAGLRSGHIPGSINLPFQALLEEGRLKSAADLKSAMSDVGIDFSRPIISSCGSGVTAAFLNLALTEIGVNNAQLFDGSWSQWGADKNLPIGRS